MRWPSNELSVKFSVRRCSPEGSARKEANQFEASTFITDQAQSDPRETKQKYHIKLNRITTYMYVYAYETKNSISFSSQCHTQFLPHIKPSQHQAAW
jgi:hypothetical protein